MTRDEVLAMKPGRELDALVAEEVMRVSLCKHRADKNGKCVQCGLNEVYFIRIDPPAYYSTNVGDAWMVVEHVIKDGGDISLHSLRFEKLEYAAEFTPMFGWNIAYGNSPSEAICKAALLVSMYKEKHD